MKTKVSDITVELQSNEYIYRSMIEGITDAFIALDKDGFFTYINAKAEKILSRPHGYLIGKNIWKEYEKSSNEEFEKAVTKAMELQETVYLEEYHTRNDLWFENHIYPSPDGVCVFIRDITERKNREISFNKVARRNALLLQMMQNSFLLTDADLNVVDVNPAFCKTIGYSREELLTMNITDFDTAFSDSEIKENFKKVSHGNIMEFETKNRKKDGTIIDVEVVLAEVEIEGQMYFASFGRDISERKKAEQQILNERNLSDSIINSLPGIFYLYDRDGNFLRWNKNFETVSGYTAEEIIHMRPLDFFHDDDKKLLDEKITEVFEKGSAEVEAPFYTRNKEKISYYFNGRRAHIDGKSCLIGMGIDITERNKVQQDILQMEQKMLNQKVQEQKRITRAVIKAQETERNHIGRELHDNVNQIIAGTILYLTMAGKRDERIKDLIKYPLQLLKNSINEIRALTGKNVTPLRNVNLEELVEVLIGNTNKSTEMKIVFHYDVSKDFKDDELKLNLYRIIQEQVNNIVKHAAPTAVIISLGMDEDFVCLTTRDNGTGFDVNKRRKGSGITAMINRVESFNGKIDIESSPGTGTTIRIKIPYQSNQRTCVSGT